MAKKSKKKNIGYRTYLKAKLNKLKILKSGLLFYEKLLAVEAANFHPRGLPSIRISFTHEEWKKIIPDTFQSQITQIKDTGKREG